MRILPRIVLAVQVKRAVEMPSFWTQLAAAIKFLKPFADFIHQIEADRPAFGRCYEGIHLLDAHIRACTKEREVGGADYAGSKETAIRTWERRRQGG